MRTTSHTFRAALALAAVMFGLAFAVAPSASPVGGGRAIAAALDVPPVGAPARGAGPAQATPAPATFVGDDTCVTCHESQSYRGFSTFIRLLFQF